MIPFPVLYKADIVFTTLMMFRMFACDDDDEDDGDSIVKMSF
jgi:hypothetical protein